MLNFNGIYECALHPRDLEESPDRLALASALRLELENVVWPSACPWIGTDSWLLRFIDRAEDSLKEPIDQDADGKPKPKLSAKERVLATLKWREENGVNTILETKEPAVLQIFANWPFDVHGATTKGDIPIVIERVALVHPRPFLERFTLEESTRAAIYVREWLLRELYERTEGKLSKYVFICSAAGLGFRHGHHPLFTLLDRVFMMDEAHCKEKQSPSSDFVFFKSCSFSIDPNSVCSYFVIQTPWLFSLLKVHFFTKFFFFFFFFFIFCF